MLVKLTSEQVAGNWDFIRESVIQFSPLELRPTEDRLHRVLDALLMDQMQAWAYAELMEGQTKLFGIVLTTVLENGFVGIKNLLIYSVVGFGDSFTPNHWKRGLLALAQFARSRNCQQIIAYTENDQLITLSEKLGANTRSRVLVFPLN